ncbi:MAG: MtrB/PioB family outer membrane beta-barrel protein [Deltaproteobacteria bacterium]|nr:MtrB/PioB family outer membrane beta-barrel protein [Deltaproteobacteria bacterium]
MAAVVTVFAAAFTAAFAPPRALAAEERQSVLAGPLLAGIRDVDPRGLTTLVPFRRRTPSGFLYPYPLLPQPFHGDRFLLRASVEAGWLFERGDDHEARYTEYADLRDGPLLRRFSFEGKQREGLFHFLLEGGSVGRADGFYRAELGQTGRFRLRARYDALPHVYGDDARILFRGVGSETLSLPAGLVPGANPAGDVAAALAGVGERRIVQSRNDSTVDLRVSLRPELTWLSAYHLDRRHGERPFGGTLGLPFGTTNSGSVTELLEPIESRTHEVSTALEWATTGLQANLRYRASLYDNRRESLTWENPFAASDLGFLLVPGPPAGRAALAPDNASHQLQGELAAALPWQGRFVASGAWTRMQQDETLLPATINGNITSFSNLPRRHAGARVDTWMLQSKLRLRPVRPVDLQLDFRLFDRDGDTNYTALDPATGAYGYVVEDLGPTNRVGAPPFSHRRWHVGAGADWRITRRTKLGLAYTHEETRRANRARQLTRDDRLRAHLSSRLFQAGNTRFSYEFLKRTGSDYDPTRDAAYYASSPLSVALAGPARSLQPFRQYDLARSQGHELEWRTNWGIGQSGDLAFTTRYRERDYGSDYGVRDERGAEASLDASWLPSPRVEVHGSAGIDWRDRRMRTIDSSFGPPNDLRAGGPTFPFPNTWSWQSVVTTLSTGTGLTLHPLRTIDLVVDYRLLYSRERVDTDFDRAGGALPFGIDPATAVRRYAPQRLVDHVLSISGTKHWTDQLALTLLYRLYDSTIVDAQQTGLAPLINQNLYLASIDDDFRVHLVALTARFRY